MKTAVASGSSRQSCRQIRCAGSRKPNIDKVTKGFKSSVIDFRDGQLKYLAGQSMEQFSWSTASMDFLLVLPFKIMQADISTPS